MDKECTVRTEEQRREDWCRAKAERRLKDRRRWRAYVRSKSDMMLNAAPIMTTEIKGQE